MHVPMAGIPQSDRPRERLRARGPHDLSARELLALVLRQGARGASALQLADMLLSTHGSLGLLARARVEELARVPGIGNAKASALVAAFQLGRLAVYAKDQPVTVRGPRDIVEVAQGELEGRTRERVLVVVCDARNQVRHVETVAFGGMDHSPVPIREILNCVLRHDGRAFAIAHNHPSGDPTPSPADREATARLAAAAAAVDVRLLDHVIVAGHDWRRVSSGP